MEMKTARLALPAVFLGIVMGAGALREQPKDLAARQQQFTDCFNTALQTDYPSRATPAERARAQTKAADITRTAHASVGIQLTGTQMQTPPADLTNSQIIINHCAAKSRVQITERWTSGDQPLPTLK